jgi:hypothetical protein
MASELENSVKKAAEQIVKYVEDAATLKVRTRYVEISAETGASAQPKPAAYTEIKLDGDADTVIPVRKDETTSELEVDIALFDIHERNVQTAIEYRARMLDALIEVLQTQTRGRLR